LNFQQNDTYDFQQKYVTETRAENILFQHFFSINCKTVDIPNDQNYFQKYFLPNVSGVFNYFFADVDVSSALTGYVVDAV